MPLAARYTSARTLDTAPVPTPPPGPGEVELAPAYVGICGTDLHIFHGDMDARVSAPAVLGHEMSGRVVRVGADVEGWRPGDAVTVMPLRWDDSCPVLDRIGSGDGFAAGLIHGLLTGASLQRALAYGTAHGALVMTTPGDVSMATLTEVEALVAGGSAHVRR
jgi:NADPH:quinone reductase-like Zn-dependent oxidoreductase